jgi:hypothetical protein
MAEALVAHLKRAFEESNAGRSKVNSDILALSGMSGAKTRHFYNNLLQLEDARYLEVGTWKGSSVCSAMCGNSAQVVCIDNWAEFGGPKAEFLHNFEQFKGANNAQFIESNAFKVNVAQLPKFNIYMYDGDHSQNAHRLALTHFINAMDDVFIFVVDDWNWDKVRRGTRQAIQELKLDVVFEHEIRYTQNDQHTPKPIAEKEYWNGIWAAVLRKRS